MRYLIIAALLLCGSLEAQCSNSLDFLHGDATWSGPGTGLCAGSYPVYPCVSWLGFHPYTEVYHFVRFTNFGPWYPIGVELCHSGRSTVSLTCGLQHLAVGYRDQQMTFYAQHTCGPCPL